jgi:hypothetical protein
MLVAEGYVLGIYTGEEDGDLGLLVSALTMEIPQRVILYYDGDNGVLWFKAGNDGARTQPGGVPTGNGDTAYTFRAGDLECLDSMISDRSLPDVGTASATDLTLVVHNRGTASDRAEALAAILPIARRVYERENSR